MSIALVDAQLPALKTELTTDPKSLGLVALSGVEAAAKLNLAGASVETLPIETVVDSWRIVSCVTFTDWGALAAADRQLLQIIVSANRVDIGNANIRSLFQSLFGAATTTRANLLALVNKSVSRAEKLFGTGVFIGEHDVLRARAL